MHRRHIAAMVVTAFCCRPTLLSPVAEIAGLWAAGSRLVTLTTLQESARCPSHAASRSAGTQLRVLAPATEAAHRGGGLGGRRCVSVRRRARPCRPSRPASRFGDPRGMSHLPRQPSVCCEQLGLIPWEIFRPPCLCLLSAAPPAALTSKMLYADVLTGAHVEHGGRSGG